MAVLLCAGCREAVAHTTEENHVKLAAMQIHDRACLAHEFNGVPCRHSGNCYQEEVDS